MVTGCSAERSPCPVLLRAADGKFIGQFAKQLSPPRD